MGRGNLFDVWVGFFSIFLFFLDMLDGCKYLSPYSLRTVMS